jgi:RNA polymerase sigma-70 factor (ECF subfamily)
MKGLAPPSAMRIVKGGMAGDGGELIARMAGRDQSAFGPFYDRYASLVHPLISRIVRDRADAADVLQEVFWESWQAAGSYDPSRGSPEAWIVMRARARAIDRVRSVRRRGETFVAPLDEGMAPSTPTGPDVADAVSDRSIVQGLLARLSDSQREVIELAYFGGLTQTEIADRLKQPLGTVKTRMRMGLERLREALKAERS